ncbi:protein NRT1/ PTR FAMILY 1.2-like isoform X5 [Panicum miliaceum]|uniref:Protein NRT1/ PTR FAMILY 1.2-like isoform X5 n=1 Tax=Panicum miliaceum TaxID=4540 RepID=A0A3L6R5E7_PANMI|nr:protein NRT1/ PTR FAMILY 1.2-like isoform X5 [Panicum miliaceum]
MEPSLAAETEPAAGGRFKGKKGRYRALPFIFLNEMLEKVAGFGLNTNMITYLTKKYHLSTVASQTMLFVWSAISNFAPIPGAVVADMYLGRFMAVALGSVACLIRRDPRSASAPMQRRRAVRAAGGEAPRVAALRLRVPVAGRRRRPAVLHGVRRGPVLEAPKEQRSRILQAYFNAYYASIGVAFTIAVTAIVYLQDNVGWSVGFAVSMGLMLLSTVSFLLGSGLYIKEKGKRRMFSGIGAAVGAAIGNHRARLPAKTGDGVYHHLKDSKLTVPTDQLSWVYGEEGKNVEWEEDDDREQPML